MDSILQRVARGDTLAVQQCIERYGGLVYSLAKRLCPNGAEIDDAVQEVFIELWRKAERFDPRIADEVVFVAMVARRRLIDVRRRTARHESKEELPDALESPHALQTDTVEARDSASVAARAFVKLRPEEQRVLRLAVWDGLSHQRIADVTGLPLGTVKTHARRGLSRLREMLEPSSARAAGGVA